MGEKRSSISGTDGERVYCKYSSSTTRKEEYMNDVINTCYVRSCRLLHGSYSWLATATANIFSAGISAPI